MSETLNAIVERIPMIVLMIISIAQFIMILINNKSGYEKLEQKKQNIINKYLKQKATTEYKLEKISQKIEQKEKKENVRDDNKANNGRNDENQSND